MPLSLLFISVLAIVPLQGVRENRATPCSVSELLRRLPPILHENPKADLSRYFEEITICYQADPSVLDSLQPAFVANLADTTPGVQANTLLMLHTFSQGSSDPSLELSLTKQLVTALASSDEFTQRAALLAVENLRQSMPDVVVEELASLLRQGTSAEEVLIGAGEALMLARPTDDTAELTVIASIDNENLSPAVRKGLIYSSANSAVGSRIVQKLVSMATTSADKDFRDAAIGASTRLGARGVVPISAVVLRISQDKNESEKSRQIAAHANEVMAKSAH